MDILAIYQFCSFGGVERVLLNRAIAFREYKLQVNISVGYLQDFGAMDSFKRYIQTHHLDQFINPFLISDFTTINLNKYDLILVIDTPQILDNTFRANNLFIECHTSYKDNRQYLQNIPSHVMGILVPSSSFASLLKSEFPGIKDIFVLPNPIPEEFSGTNSTPRIFGNRPLTYLSRIDALKNFYEAVQIFNSIQDRSDIFQIIVGQGETPNKIISFLGQNHLLGNTLIREKIDFENIPSLISLVKHHKGVFLSPSKGESFGLSAAEFIFGGVPVLLSDIPAHQELVDHDKRFLYPLGNINSAKLKLTNILDDWDNLSLVISSFGTKFINSLFIKSWINFLENYGLKK
jgi:glycosyltransferase involved in cell wall biosynthesis